MYEEFDQQMMLNLMKTRPIVVTATLSGGLLGESIARPVVFLGDLERLTLHYPGYRVLTLELEWDEFTVCVTADKSNIQFRRHPQTPLTSGPDELAFLTDSSVIDVVTRSDQLKIEHVAPAHVFVSLSTTGLIGNMDGLTDYFRRYMRVFTFA